MARDNRIERTERTGTSPAPKREFSTSDRVQLLVSQVLNNVSERLEEKRAQEDKKRPR